MKAGNGEMYQPIQSCACMQSWRIALLTQGGRLNACVRACIVVNSVNRADRKCRHVTDASQKIGSKQRGL